MGNFSVVVLDFETTGLSPDRGDRAIEIGALLIRDNRIVDRFQSLMNPGMRISGFIENYTGITNKMLAQAPPVAEVMARFAAFIDGHHLVAHNASFDARFLDGELRRINLQRGQDFACSLLLSRRIYPDALSHSLEALVRYKNLKTNGVHHRALADAEMTAHLWLAIIADLKREHGFASISFELLRQVAKVSKKAVPSYLKRLAEEGRCA